MNLNESDLYSIVYTSAAVRLFSRTELDKLAMRARIRNRREAITGVLLYYDGSFLQCLEGPKAGLTRVYEAICADRRHRQISELLLEPIERRDYSEWSMASHFIGGDLRSQDDDHLIARLTPKDGTSISRHLVSAFWANGMNLKYSRALA